MPMPKPKRVEQIWLPKRLAKDVIYRIRITATYRKAMKALAKGNKLSVSEWIRSTLRTAANA